MTLVIKTGQLEQLSEDWTKRLVQDLCALLRERFARHPDSAEARRCAQEPAILHPYVDAVVRRAVPHGFARRDDLVALVDGCLAHGAERFLSDDVLRQAQLSPALKVSLMRRLAQGQRSTGALA